MRAGSQDRDAVEPLDTYTDALAEMEKGLRIVCLELQSIYIYIYIYLSDERNIPEVEMKTI